MSEQSFSTRITEAESSALRALAAIEILFRDVAGKSTTPASRLAAENLAACRAYIQIAAAFARDYARREA